MPVVNLPIALLNEHLGATIAPDDLVEHLQHIGCDVEGYETMGRYRCAVCGAVHEVAEHEEAPVRCDECGVDYRERTDAVEAIDPVDVIRMELLPVRPDVFDPGGLARALRTYLEIDMTPPHYEAVDGDYTVDVDASVADVRPCIACCVVRGVTLDDTRIRVVMKLQENLHWAIGRDRKFASIGVYDLSAVEGRAIRYRTVGRGDNAFVPLGYTDAATPDAILAEHPKGKAFAGLLEGHDRVPLLEDERGGVMSMPPIINSEHTRVTTASTDFFIDVTGLNPRVVRTTLAILATSLAELNPGVVIERVQVRYPDGHPEGPAAVTTPDLRTQALHLDPARAARLIGIDASTDDVGLLLRRMGHDVATESDGRLRVTAPPYRNDLLHEVDLVEDAAIAYGFHNIETRLVPTMTVGRARPIEDLSNHARRVLAGLGFLETIALPITSKPQAFDRIGLDETPTLELANPIHDDSGTPLDILRPNLLAGLIHCLHRYRGGELPQRLFEIGDVTQLDADRDTGTREVRRCAAVAIGPRAGFAEARSLCEAITAELGWSLEAEPLELGCYLSGRAARWFAVRGDRRVAVGHFGEVHPDVLERYGLGYPVGACEFDLAPLDPTGAA